MQLSRQTPACCPACQPTQGQRPGPALRRSECRQCCDGSMPGSKPVVCCDSTRMVTHCICDLAQGYYDLPRAITDTVATESDIQMLVCIQGPCFDASSSLAVLRRPCWLLWMPSPAVLHNSTCHNQLHHLSSSSTACPGAAHRNSAVVLVHPLYRAHAVSLLFWDPVPCH